MANCHQEARCEKRARPDRINHCGWCVGVGDPDRLVDGQVGRERRGTGSGGRGEVIQRLYGARRSTTETACYLGLRRRRRRHRPGGSPHSTPNHQPGGVPLMPDSSGYRLCRSKAALSGHSIAHDHQPPSLTICRSLVAPVAGPLTATPRIVGQSHGYAKHPRFG
jgi:hypothetical protein